MYLATGVEPTKLIACNLRMMQQSIDCGFCSDHKTYDAFRQTSLLEKVNKFSARKRHALGGLQDESISASDRVWEKPQRNHRREIKRSDRGHYPERLPNHDLVDAARHILQVVALHERGNAARDLDILYAATQLRLGLRQESSRFQVLWCARCRQSSVEKLLELEKKLNAIGRGCFAPGGESSGTGLNHFRYLLGCSERNALQRFRRRGINDFHCVLKCRHLFLNRAIGYGKRFI